MKKLFLTMLMGLFVPLVLFGQHYEYVITDVNASILIRDFILADRHPGDGDEIGVFTPDGICAGAIIIEDPRMPVGIAAWGDDFFDTTTVNGFRENESFEFRYWDESESEEIVLQIYTVVSGPAVWQAQGITMLTLADENLMFFNFTSTEYLHFITINEITVWLSDDHDVAPEDLDQIGIFTPEGVPAGVLIWDAESSQAIGWAYGDNPETEEVEGFIEDEEFHFRYWHSVFDEFADADADYVSGDPTFLMRNGNTVVSLEVQFSSVKKQHDLPNKFQILGLYPNPANSVIRIDFENPIASMVNVSIWDFTGRQVLKKSKYKTALGTNYFDINLDNLSSGSYIIRLDQDSKTILKHFIHLK